MTINTADSRTVAEHGRYTIGSVTSKDGTTIGYRQLGHGPGVVLLHGAMESAQSHMQLADALANAFTVYLPDRRGRGLSGPYSKDYSIQKEVEDLGAHNVFGISSGAVIALQAALTLPAIHKAAIFEPPFFVNDLAAVTDVLTRFDREMLQGKMTAALVTAWKGTQMWGYRMPRWLLELMTKMMMAQEDKKAKGDDVTMRMLAPTWHYDAQLVIEMSKKLESFRTIRADVLLLGGSKSPAFLKADLDALEKVLSNAKRVEFPGLNHGGSGNTNRGGQPEVVAQELRRFFA